jgi:hypothetical protein
MSKWQIFIHKANKIFLLLHILKMNIIIKKTIWGKA